MQLCGSVETVGMKPLLRTTGSALLFVAAGCASRIAYSPSCVYDEMEARRVTRRFLEEQPAQYAPIQIEITEEKISLTRFRSKGTGLRGDELREVPAVSTIYRDNIGSTELVYRHQWHMHHWYVARVFDKNGSLFVRVRSRSLEHAQQFLDAIASLRVPVQPGGRPR